MLRGKFGQIGSKLRDGHIVMDAFQQAAFRDHIRSGERIMFLASMGRLKHKRTRNTLAAEPTPRSSCPSEADQTPPPPSGYAAPDRQAETRTYSVNKDATSRPNAKKTFDHSTSPSKSGPQIPESTESAPDSSNWDQCGRRKPTHGERVAAAQSPSAGNGENVGRGSSAADLPPRRGSERHNRSPINRRQQLDRRGSRRNRPRSAGPGEERHRPPSPGVGGITRGLQQPPDAAANPSKTDNRRAVSAAATRVHNVPLHVGPEVSPASPAKGPGSHGVVPGASSSSSVSRPRARPATAEGCRREGTAWRRARRPDSPWEASRKIGDGDGGAGAVNQTEARRAHQTSNAMGAVGGGGGGCDQLSPKEDGSFAASVVRSARPLADYDNVDVDNFDQWRVAMHSPNCCGGAYRPRSANAAVRSTAAVANTTADTRFMPVKTIGEAFHGHRLAGVQAWDPNAAAAVRAARAERFLRRAIIGKTKGGPMAAPPDKTHRREAAGMRGCNSEESILQHGEPEDQHRGVPTSARRGWADGEGRPVDLSSTADLRKDCRRALARRKISQAAAPAFEKKGGVSPNPNRRAGWQWASTPRGRTGGGGGGDDGGGVHHLGTVERNTLGRSPCFSRPSTAASEYGQQGLKRGMGGGSTTGSTASNSSSSSSSRGRGDSALSTARTSAAATTNCSSYSSSSSRGDGSCRSSSRRSAHRSVSSSGGSVAEERRARLLTELETLRRRMEETEDLLLEVDSSMQSKPRRRPHSATIYRRASQKPRDRTSSSGGGRRESTVATPGNTSTKSSAGYGAFNLGERRMCPLVVTHSANDFLGQL